MEGRRGRCQEGVEEGETLVISGMRSEGGREASRRLPGPTGGDLILVLCFRGLEKFSTAGVSGVRTCTSVRMDFVIRALAESSRRGSGGRLLPIDDG